MADNSTSKGVAALDWAYKMAMSGINNSFKSVQELADSYVAKYGRTDKAIDKLISDQRKTVTTTGFVTGLGGLITLPVTIPADLASSLYVELRLIETIAAIRGFDVQSEKVKTVASLCLVGNSIGDILKQAGMKKLSEYTAKKLIPKITTDIVIKVAQAVGLKISAKTAGKVVANAGKAIPLLGGIVGGAWNYVEISTVAKYTKQVFNENNLDDDMAQKS